MSFDAFGTLQAGLVLSGKYELVRPLGVGGMGAVYEAQHTVVGRRFAIKFLHAEFARSADMLARFRREAQAAGGLENEHIVAITDFGSTDDGFPYMVMEYLEGEDLRGVLTREGRLSPLRASQLLIQACRGLGAAHARGIVHRDLKPENLFIVKRSDGTEVLKILDFGIAKLKSHVTSGASTRPGAMMGTLYYMPPEQVRGDKGIDERADIYALGAILYEATCGEVAFPGSEAHVVLYKIMHERPTPLSSRVVGLPDGFEAVVERAMAFDRETRFQSVAELSEALEQFAGRASALPSTTDVARVPTVLATSLPLTVNESSTGTAPPGATLDTQQALSVSRYSPASPRRGLVLGALITLGAVGTALGLWRPWASATTEPTPAAALSDLTAAPPVSASASAETPVASGSAEPDLPPVASARPEHDERSGTARARSAAPMPPTASASAAIPPSVKPPAKPANRKELTKETVKRKSPYE